MKIQRTGVFYSLVGLFLLFNLLMMNACQSVESENTTTENNEDSVVVKKVQKAFGIPIDPYIEKKDIIHSGEVLSNILSSYQIDAQEIAKIADKSKDIFDVRKFKVGNPYTIFYSKDSLHQAKYFVYQPNAIDYIVYDLTDTIHIYKDHFPVTTREQTASGIIEGSLYRALSDVQGGKALAAKLGEVYAWDIDFYRIKKGDWFKVVYEEKYVKGKPVDLGKIKAAVLNHSDHKYYAFYFKGDSSEGGYYNEDAKSLRKAFLKAPLNTYRISSHYTHRRFHPIQHRWKAHLGTDYAAPKGTPIMATAGGVVIASRRTRYNGNYVKIRHNSVYTTQYLHMSKRAVRTGQHVKQGQTIGYVGMTGLATGPHVCYRFWKNGRQVDPYSQHFPPANPIAKSDSLSFVRMKNQLEQKLTGISLNKMKTSSSSKG